MFGHKVRRAPIEVHVKAVLILRVDILEIVGEAEHGREFISGLSIERLIPGRYDDGAFSGAALERPALQQLLADIRGGGRAVDARGSLFCRLSRRRRGCLDVRGRLIHFI